MVDCGICTAQAHVKHLYIIIIIHSGIEFYQYVHSRPSRRSVIFYHYSLLFLLLLLYLYAI